MYRTIIFFFIWILPLSCYAQQQAKIDSLQRRIKLEKVDTTKVSLLLQISELYLSSQADMAIEYARQATSLSERAEYAHGLCESLFMEGFGYFQKSAYPTALEIYEKALAIAQQYQFTKNELNILLNIGVVHDLRSNNDKAFEIYQQVLNRSIASSDKRTQTKAQQNIAILHIKKGEYREALHILIDVLPIFDELGATTDKAKTTLNIGNLYSLFSDYDYALPYLHQSLDMWEHLQDQSGIARTSYNLGTTYQELGQHWKAEEYYGKALELQQKLGNQRGLAYNLNSLAAIQSDAGDYAKAIDFFQQSNHLFQEMGLTEEVAASLSSLGLAYSEMGDSQMALENYQQALQIHKQLDNPRGKANVLHHIGMVYLKEESPDKAATYLKQAYEINLQLGDKKEIAKNLLALGELYQAQNESDKTLASYEKAVQYYTQVYPDKKHFKLAQVYDKISRYYLSKEEWDQAADYNQKSMVSLLPSDCEEAETCWRYAFHAHEYLKVLNTRSLIIDKTYARNPGDLSLFRQSLQTYEISLALIDSLRENFRTGSKRTLMTNTADIFESYLQALHLLYDTTSDTQWLEQAFAVMERYRYHVISEVFTENTHLKFTGLPDSLLEQERSLQSAITFYHEKLLDAKAETSSPDQEQIAFLSEKLFEKNNAYDSLVRELQTQYPEYYQLTHHSPLASLSTIQQNVLNEDQALLEYFAGDKNLYLIAAVQDQLHFEKIAYDSSLQKAIVNLEAGFSTKRQGKKSFQQYITDAFKVYKKLMAPVSSVIHDKKLIIIPDGILGYLPFETLLATEADLAKSYKDLPYLIREHEISYHYSASLLAYESEQQKYSQNSFIGFAPTFTNNIAQEWAAYQEDVRTYPNSTKALPYAEEEVRSIASLLEGQAYTGLSATEHSFKQNAGAYNIIHLASHSLVDDTNPLYSKLLFDSERDSIEDGLLHTYELYNMRLNANLVCLSACNTGIGKYFKGEGIVSLARGFMYAGSPNVMMSLWSVADHPTKDIMQFFYDELNQGTAYTTALHNAKLRYLDHADNITADPYYWGAFIYLGQPMDNSSNNSKLIWVGFSLLVLLLLLTLIYLYRLRKSQAL